MKFIMEYEEVLENAKNGVYGTFITDGDEGYKRAFMTENGYYFVQSFFWSEKANRYIPFLGKRQITEFVYNTAKEGKRHDQNY